MSLFKRMYTTVTAGFDQLIGEIENHDALIQVTITEQRKKIAAAKVQLNRIRNSATQVRDQIVQLKLDEQSWTKRATKEACQDETKALLCLQQRKITRAQIEKLQIAQSEYQRTVEKMSADIVRCEDELKAMTQKHELMRARQTSADALNVINETGAPQLKDLEMSFDRWEIRIAQHEINVETFEKEDAFARGYLESENEEALRNELAELVCDKMQQEKPVDERANKESGNEYK